MTFEIMKLQMAEFHEHLTFSYAFVHLMYTQYQVMHSVLNFLLCVNVHYMSACAVYLVSFLVQVRDHSRHGTLNL